MASNCVKLVSLTDNRGKQKHDKVEQELSVPISEETKICSRERNIEDLLRGTGINTQKSLRNASRFLFLIANSLTKDRKCNLSEVKYRFY